MFKYPYVTTEAQFFAAVEEGIQALREGQTVEHKAVVEAFERMISPDPRTD